MTLQLDCASAAEAVKARQAAVHMMASRDGAWHDLRAHEMPAQSSVARRLRELLDEEIPPLREVVGGIVVGHAASTRVAIFKPGLAADAVADQLRDESHCGDWARRSSRVKCTVTVTGLEAADPAASSSRRRAAA
jgi:hypothetical protein